MLIFFCGGTDSFIAMMERRACVIWMLLGLFLREAAAQDLAPEEGKTTVESETHGYYSQRIEDAFNPSDATVERIHSFIIESKTIEEKNKQKKTYK